MQKTTPFKKTIEVRWADVDQNKHVRHSAYYDYGAFVRVRFFAEKGFDSNELEKLKIGPIVFKESCHFIREIGPDDTLTVNILKGEVNDDASRWTLHNEIFNQNGQNVAHITGVGAWMDTNTRKLTSPPESLKEAFHLLPMGEEYVYKKEK